MYSLNDLNPVQQEAATHGQGPLLILAGAGSGKTRVLTYRITHLLAAGEDPRRILAITFTNKAAKEMKSRIETLAGSEARGMWIMTFHSACLRILRREITKLGYSRDFVIYDVPDQMSLIKSVMQSANIDQEKLAPKAVAAAISDVKNKLLPLKTTKLNANDYFEEQVATIFPIYQERLKSNNAVDFDDLIMLTVRVFREYPDVLQHYQEQFRHILVDEYQDTNAAQYELVKALAANHRNLCVVGDDDQSVYGWRGADVQNILSFEEDYPEARVLKLEQNYRSTGKILAAANAVVHQNEQRKDKSLWTEKAEGEDLEHFLALDDRDEARFVVRRIHELMDGEGRRCADFTILYRTNAQSRVLEETLMRDGMPYRILSGVKFFERAEIKDLLAYLRLVQNPADTVSFSRIINVPRRGLGAGSLDKILTYAHEQEMPILESLTEAKYIPGLKERGQAALTVFYSTLQEARQRAEEGWQVATLIKFILDVTGYKDRWENEKKTEAESRLQNIGEFISLAAEYDSSEVAAEFEGVDILRGFLEQVSLVTDIDSYDETEDAVKLMTMHSAKGLEFPVVFSVGMDEGLFPTKRSEMAPEELEEERRLCYVTITRGRERVIFTSARKRMRFGQTTPSIVSRFINEVPTELLAVSESEEGPGQARKDKAQVRRPWRQKGAILVDPDPTVLTVGDRVQHPSFGAGIVMSVTGEGQGAEIAVVFETEVKRLMAGYAKLEKCES